MIIKFTKHKGHSDRLLNEPNVLMNGWNGTNCAEMQKKNRYIYKKTNAESAFTRLQP